MRLFSQKEKFYRLVRLIRKFMSIVGRIAQLIIGIVIGWYGFTLVSEDGSDIFTWIAVLIGAGSVLSALFPDIFDISTDQGDSGSTSDSGGDGD
ncbi:MAG: hypothetical protein ACI92O_002931 [Colwellia sp.]